MKKSKGLIVFALILSILLFIFGLVVVVPFGPHPALNIFFVLFTAFMIGSNIYQLATYDRKKAEAETAAQRLATDDATVSSLSGVSAYGSYSDFGSQSALPRERHGCVTAYLTVMLIFGVLGALMWHFGARLFDGVDPADPSMPATSLLTIADIAFVVLLLKWKRIGFWGFAASGVCMVAFSIGSDPTTLIQSISGLVGIGILFAILQFTRNGVSAWKNLEGLAGVRWEKVAAVAILVIQIHNALNDINLLITQWEIVESRAMNLCLLVYNLGLLVFALLILRLNPCQYRTRAFPVLAVASAMMFILYIKWPAGNYNAIAALVFALVCMFTENRVAVTVAAVIYLITGALGLFSYIDMMPFPFIFLNFILFISSATLSVAFMIPGSGFDKKQNSL